MRYSGTESPILSNASSGDLSYINNETVQAEVESRIEDKNIYKLVKEEMRNIDFSNFYLYEERWHKEFGKRTQRQNIGAKIF